MKYYIFFVLGLFFSNAYSQKGDIRGNVYDKNTGEPISFASVFLKGTTIGTTTNESGFYTLSAVPVGDYTLVVSFIGYDTLTYDVSLRKGQIINKQFSLVESNITLEEISISGKKEQSRTEVRVSSISITPKEIKALPSTGGEADIAQYLQIIPGVITTGDQGGQIYIRGGSPVQNKILLDGMTIFNPFHSIGIFSVFETEIIRSAEVLTGGFSAEYGGRVSAIVDMKTREGNKTHFGGLATASPFMSKLLLEGPISKYREGKGGSTSFLITGKQSYIDQTSKQLYKYALDTLTGSLPFSFTDIYGKISTISENGSFLNLFGFNFNDRVKYTGLANLNWQASGGGANFKLIPGTSSIIVGGSVAFSDYKIKLDEKQSDPRTSNIRGLQANIDFSYFGRRSEIKYGLEFNAFKTDFEFTNFLKVPILSESNNTEIAGFVKYRFATKLFVFDPSFRMQYYASLSQVRFEPRLGMKMNVTNNFRLKAAGGLYSQNLMSSVSERDIVNLFVGFLTSPELIYASHAVGGFELDLSTNTELNVETYYKDFSRLFNLNRNKRKVQDPDYTEETGNSYGIDFLLKSNWVNWRVWLGYSLGFVNRDDGVQKFPALFDRRHNINFVLDYQWGRAKCWEAGMRWNLGSGFAFTKIQGFIGDNFIPNGLETNFGIENPDIGVVYAEKINSGRLPYYHRLDFSIKRRIDFTKFLNLEIVASVTNAYDRKNIFYFNVVENKRVNQLPVLPSLLVALHF
ncbi:MAG TPA: TonB-dependent receptor [Saprospiraceae bacterium]|nr:TonB-dependent receptor [Saprospiraceae bacterium]